MRFLRENGLSIAAGLLFLGSLIARASRDSESFQNWQSEFLSVGALVLLSIVLRERGSPQSKPIASPHAATGD